MVKAVILFFFFKYNMNKCENILFYKMFIFFSFLKYNMDKCEHIYCFIKCLKIDSIIK